MNYLIYLKILIGIQFSKEII